MPALISGVAARRVLHRHKRPNQPAPGAVADGTVARADPVPTGKEASPAHFPPPEVTEVLVKKPGENTVPSAAPAIEPLPTDLRLAQAGHVYRGSLPPPATTAKPVSDDAPAPALRAASPASKPAALTGWSALGHYVVGHLSERSSVLLARGSGVLASPAPPCNGLPLAVLAPATLVEAAARRAADRSWLDALRTLDVTVVLTGTEAVADAATTKAGLPAPIVGDTLLVASTPADMPAIRAKVAARYCVVAIAGSDAADFPNGYLPATTPVAYRDRWGAGWFFFPPR